MSNEMDMMGMDERQRLAWLRANRVTLMAVGLTWIGMIGWEWARGTFPVFLTVMVPVFALVRFAAYRLFVRT
jgi:hypothetical protein